VSTTRENIRWTAILERAKADALPVANLHVRLYDDGNFHHGAEFCGHVAKAVGLTAQEAVNTVIPGWCECGGWMGTRFGSLLHAVAEQYRAIEDETSGVRHADWDATWHAFTTVDDQRSWVYRTDDLELENLRQRTRLATLAVLERSRPLLDLTDLERRIGAQALRVPVLPADGGFLQRWAHDLRIDPRPQPHQRRIPRPCEYDQLLDAALSKARDNDDRVLAVVLPGNSTALPIDLGLPAELGLFLWALGLGSGQTLLLHLLRPVGEGLAVIAEQHHRVAVASGDEKVPEILEAVKTLCEDTRGGVNAGMRIDLDEILATSRML